MNKKVVCINDKNLPPGAEVKEGGEYEVEESFVNSYDQIVYIIAGISNKGRTKFGLPWIGYSSLRFKNLDAVKETAEEYNYALN